MMVHHMEALGHAIQVLRTERRMSRAALARAAALSYPYVSEIETGHKCSLAALYAIASGLCRPGESRSTGINAGDGMSATVGGNVETSTSHICDWLNADDPCHYLSVEAPCPGCGAEWSRVADILRAYTLECTSDCEYAAAFQIAFGE